ncbi:MAG TPA: DUF2637 domain-containing protein [Streptosporangiaceae bacterium]|nr:DUF2637 domain-containing protein [Streptosporangiaceae bacterium]
MTASLRVPRSVALAVIAVLVAAASAASFAESYRGLYLWAHEHGLRGVWAAGFPLQVDVFIAVGEMALFVALADRWAVRSRIAAWAVTAAGLAVSVAGNIGHVQGHSLTDRGTAAIPPLAAAAALAVGLGVLKRVVSASPGPYDATDILTYASPWHTPAADTVPSAAEPVAGAVPSSVLDAAKVSMAATIAAGNPWSVNQLTEQFSLTRGQATKIRRAALSDTNGHAT